MPRTKFIVLRHLMFMVLVMAATCAAHAAEPTLDLTISGRTWQLDRKELLTHPAAQTIDIPADIAYERAMRFRAVPLAALVPSLSRIESLQFVAQDGFVANIPGAALAHKIAQPWIAIEPAETPWPALATGKSAGPFYLVWLKPEAGKVGQEYWPYQIAKIAEIAPLEKRYPQLLPMKGAGIAAQRGMQVFVANCAACHKLNGGGDAAVGPDLNKPFSPTEYFTPPFLRKLIRDPASVRDWSERKMPGYAKSALSDAQVDDLIAYLKQMASQR
jgi:mono/diheme cytochrome c family protein